MLYVITGGSGSGKSEYAERLAVNCGGTKRIYLATMQIWDEEGEKRAARHRRMRREKGFITVERYTKLEELDLEKLDLEKLDLEKLRLGKEVTRGGPSDGSASSKADVILLECMSNLTANEFYQEEPGAAERILRGINYLQKQCRTLIIVTNEVFSDGIAYDPETERYLVLLGACNRRLGEMADAVVEVVYGIPVMLKGKPL